MVIDSHFHLATDIASIRETLDGMDRHGISKTALIAPICDPIKEPPKGLLALMQFGLQRSLTRHLVKPFMDRFTETGDVILPGGAVGITPDPDNDALFEAVDAHPDRFMGWAFVNPHGMRPPLEEYARWEEHPGCIGAKAHPFWHRYPPIALASVAARLEKRGKPLLVHLGFGRHGKLAPLLDAFPRLKVVLAHAGIPYYQSFWKRFKETPNLYFDLSAHAFVSPAIMEGVVNAVGPERCFFGTDGPYGPEDEDGRFNHGLMLKMLRTTFPDKGVQALLLGESFQRMLFS